MEQEEKEMEFGAHIQNSAVEKREDVYVFLSLPLARLMKMRRERESRATQLSQSFLA